MKRLIVLAAAFLVGACGLNNQSAPELTGPSELGLSLVVTASPDTITQDGHAQSTIQVVAHDVNNQPVRGLSLRADIFVSGVEADLGTLSSKALSTDNNGQASAVYTAPAPPPATATSDTFVSIAMTPVGSNAANEVPRSVELHLARPGTLVPPSCLPATGCTGLPTAKFTFSPSSAHASDPIVFDGSSSSDPVGPTGPSGTIVSYSWSFGDGASGSGVQVTHAYGLAGTYTVTLTVTDSFGQTAQTTNQVTVATTNNPTAAFTFSPTDPVAGQTVFFNGAPSSAQTGHLVAAYAWDFGDGSSGTGQTPNHLYPTAGTYTVVLTVTDDLGHAGTTSVSVKIANSAPQAAFTFSPTNGTAPVTINFDASSTEVAPGRNVTSYQWNFGDGNFGSGVIASHLYAVTGTYQVTLTVTDNTGETSVTSQTVTVK